MLLKTGIDISRLKPPIRKKLNLISSIVNQYSEKELVITSTYEGTHSPGSLHYADLAIDIRRTTRQSIIINNLRQALGKNYDVILESTHVHIEYDPR